MNFILVKWVFGSLRVLAGLFIVLGFTFNVAALADIDATVDGSQLSGPATISQPSIDGQG